MHSLFIMNPFPIKSETSNEFFKNAIIAGKSFYSKKTKCYYKYDAPNHCLIHSSLIYGGMWYADVIEILNTRMIINSSKSGAANEQRVLLFTDLELCK